MTNAYLSFAMMKNLRRIDLGLQLFCILVIVACLLFRKSDDDTWVLLILTPVQWLSALYWGIRLKRDQKSYGRRVFEKVLLLVLALLLAGVVLLVFFQHPFLMWVLYFLGFGTVFLNVWYLGITVLELLSRRSERLKKHDHAQP